MNSKYEYQNSSNEFLVNCKCLYFMSCLKKIIAGTLANVYSHQCSFIKNQFQKLKLCATKFQSPNHYMLYTTLAMSTTSQSKSELVSWNWRLGSLGPNGSPRQNCHIPLHIKEVVIFFKLLHVIILTLYGRFLVLSLELFFQPITSSHLQTKSKRRNVGNATIQIVVIVGTWPIMCLSKCKRRDIAS